MRKAFFLFFALLCGGHMAEAQKIKTQKSQMPLDTPAIEREVKDFFDSYGEDLRRHRKEAIANRYDTRGYFRVGNGSKDLVSFAELKDSYLNKWTGPKSFEWKDLSVDVLSADSAAVTALFDWQNSSGWITTGSYTGVLIKHSGKWLIRIEDESISTTPWIIRHLLGDRTKPGPFKYTLKGPPGASIAAHRHSVDQNVSVFSGRVCLLMGDLAVARLQVFEAGSTFVIPAGTWHVEWWEAETNVVVEGTGPMLTEFATPTTPRKP